MEVEDVLEETPKDANFLKMLLEGETSLMHL
jgi:hypothetical protein